jgi:glutamate-1-semialdehyde 2,1-aminomutase
MSLNWQVTAADREVIRRELDGFLPDRIFDAHAHLHRAAWWPAPPPIVATGPAEVGLRTYRQHMAKLLPARELHALHMVYPFVTAAPEPLAAANAWLAAEVAADPVGRGLMVVRPGDDPDFVRERVRALGLRGLKPYHLYAPGERTWEAAIPDYLPEPLMVVADAEGWVVTLHLVRARGIADPSNQHWVRRYCERYPRTQLVLAHCARGFNPYHVLEGLPPLADLPNLWVDTSAVCGAMGILAALRIMGPERVLYGSDFCVSNIRGTAFSVADTFLWVDEQHPPAPPGYVAHFALPLVGVENLRAVKAAATMAKLTEAEVEALFWGNAARLLGT